MADPNEHPDEPERGPEIADADWLREPKRPAAPEASEPAEGQAPVEGGEYEVLADVPEAEPEPNVPVRPSPPKQPKRPSGPEAVAKPHATRAQPARVEQVWSRWAEWGPTLSRIVVVGLVVLGLVYATFDVANLLLPLTLILVGGCVLVLLSYPILITLERPVRMTPEQAVKDYFGALSHHVPHYRRMWLLLSEAGRSSSEYGSFEGFRAYWKRRLSELRGPTVSSMTPLVFVIDDFKSEKSAGLSEIDVTYRVVVFARGRRDEGPIASIPCRASLVRGPDRMWYLNRGTLPRGEEPATDD